jgi:hypothetical protein
VIDARVDIEFGQALIDMIGPAFAPLLDQLGLVPVAHLRAEPVFADFAHGEHDMGVGFGLPSAPISQWTLRSAIMPFSTNSALRKVARQLDALRLVSSRGMANSTSRASCASLRFSAASTAFQSFSRSANAPGAPSGSITSEWTTPVLVGEVMVAVEPLIVQPFGRRDRPLPPRRCARSTRLMTLTERWKIAMTAIHLRHDKRTSARRISAPSHDKILLGTIRYQAVSTTLQHWESIDIIISASPLNGELRCANPVTLIRN